MPSYPPIGSSRERRLVLKVKGIIWVGTAVDDRRAAADFFSEKLGLSVLTDVSGFTRLGFENGDRLELFGPDSVEHEHLDTGPVAGFWVEDIEEAHRELIESNTADVTDFERGPDGHCWFYFRGPDGNFYELSEYPTPRPPKGG